MPLLARLADLTVPTPTRSLAEQLGGWLGWTDAIALAAALKGAPAAGATATAATGPRAKVRAAEQTTAASLRAEFMRLRRQLAQAVANDAAVTAQADGLLLVTPRPGAPLEQVTDYAPYRRHTQALQRQMDDALGPWRARLRAALAAGGPAQARLAALDAVLDNTLAGRQRQLLGQVPVLLERRFRHLQQAAVADTASPDTSPRAAAPAAWLVRFGQDLHAVLQAELDLRCQPLQGLLDALDAAAVAAPAALPTPA